MKLREYLIKNNLTELNFAEILGCKQPTVSRYVNDKRSPTQTMMKKIEEFTEGTVTYKDFIGVFNGKKSEN